MNGGATPYFCAHDNGLTVVISKQVSSFLTINSNEKNI